MSAIVLVDGIDAGRLGPLLLFWRVVVCSGTRRMGDQAIYVRCLSHGQQMLFVEFHKGNEKIIVSPRLSLGMSSWAYGTCQRQ